MVYKMEGGPDIDSELQTRLQKIDVALEESGWKVKNRAMVIEELDTKQSNFKRKKYLVF